MANLSINSRNKQTKNFISNAYHKVTSKIKTFIEKLRITHKSDIDSEEDPTLFNMFLDWLLEITVYGIVLSILVNYFHHFEGIHAFYSWIIYGLARWFILDTIENIKYKVTR